MDSKIDEYLNNAKNWQKEMEQLREICLDCGLIETLKWKKPCYTFQESNIVIIQPFKNFCALMFFKGAVLDDPENVLEKPGKNSRIARRIPFTNSDEIADMEPIIKEYIQEAIEAEKKGLEVKVEKKKEPIPEELETSFKEDPEFKNAFKNLTPGRQRGYLLHFSGAKHSKTRTRRIEKYKPKITEGKGINER